MTSIYSLYPIQDSNRTLFGQCQVKNPYINRGDETIFRLFNFFTQPACRLKTMEQQSEGNRALLEKLSDLERRQEALTREINDLRHSISELHLGNAAPGTTQETDIPHSTGKSEPPPIPKIGRKSTRNQWAKPEWMKSGLEAFIGGNLANKIGILITIIGVTIGAKYVIDHDLISAIMRIILGYAAGAVLLVFALLLKRNYENFSAVLLSGAMAVFYVITFFAYDLYHLFSQGLSFGMMVAFTIVTVAAAITYNRQVIAHIGIVGAYAIPFLVGKDPGSIHVLLGYMSILNTGILVIAVGRTWKALFYNAFIITWGIFIWWFTNGYFDQQHFALTLSFLSIFFVLFYLTFLSYKLLNLEQYRIDDILVLLVNAFIFFGIGYKALSIHPGGNEWLGLFALINALIHFAVGMVIYFQKMADKGILFLITGLGVLFITIAIPVQLNGNWVTLLWAGEAALLFRIGRTQQLKWYELLAYPLMALAFYSLVDDWSTASDASLYESVDPSMIPLQNVQFLSSILFTAAFFFIRYTDAQVPAKTDQASAPITEIRKLGSYGIISILLVSLYFSFRNEISLFFNQLYTDSIVHTNSIGEQVSIQDQDLIKYRIIWNTIYTLGFISVLAMINSYKYRNRGFGILIFFLAAGAMIYFLSEGFYEMDLLKRSYMDQSMAEYYYRGAFHIVIRYIGIGMAGILLATQYLQHKRLLQDNIFRILGDLLIYASALWILSSELLYIMDLTGISAQRYGLSILWGVYCLFMITVGMLKSATNIRIMAMILLGITLIKVFLYDIKELATLPKTLVMITLGVLMLIISFLYNRYKDKFFSQNRGE